MSKVCRVGGGESLVKLNIRPITGVLVEREDILF